MRRKRIAVLMASIDREYQQKFAYGLAAAGAEYVPDEEGLKGWSDALQNHEA